MKFVIRVEIKNDKLVYNISKDTKAVGNGVMPFNPRNPKPVQKLLIKLFTMQLNGLYQDGK